MRDRSYAHQVPEAAAMVLTTVIERPLLSALALVLVRAWLGAEENLRPSVVPTIHQDHEEDQSVWSRPKGPTPLWDRFGLD